MAFTKSDLVWRRPIQMGTILLALSAFGIPSESSEPAVGQNEVADDVHAAMISIQSSRGYAVEGEVETSIAADAEIFAANFCTTPADRKAICDPTLFDSEILIKTLSDYLSDLAQMPPTINTVASRLSSLVGGTMASAGWPTTVPNSVGILDVPSEFRQSTTHVVTATGPITIGSKVNKLFFKPGQYSIFFEESPTNSKFFHLSIGARQNGTLTDTNEKNAQSGSIDAQLVNFCDVPISSIQTDSLIPFNWARGLTGTPQSRVEHMVLAASQQGVEIKIVDNSRQCDEKCRNGLGIAFAQALAVWRSGCISCNRNALSVVKIGSSVWIDMRAVQRMHSLTNITPNKADLDLSHQLVGEAVQYFATPSANVPVSSIVGYQQVDKDAEIVKSICATTTTTGDTSWLAIAHGFLCPGAALELPLHPTFSIMGTTDCGDEAIACGKPGGEVQLAMKADAYRIATPDGDVLLNNKEGAPILDIGPIVLHEVGHWFGIPHPESVDVRAPDVMQGVFDPSNTCIRRETLTLLNNAVDDRWKYAARSNLGLLPPRH